MLYFGTWTFSYAYVLQFLGTKYDISCETAEATIKNLKNGLECPSFFLRRFNKDLSKEVTFNKIILNLLKFSTQKTGLSDVTARGSYAI
jgi:hypothetical protein